MVHVKDTFTFNYFEMMGLHQFFQPVKRVSLIIGRVQMLRLQKRYRKVHIPARFKHPVELVHYFMGIFNMFEDSVTENGIKKAVCNRYFMKRRIDLNIIIMNTGRDVLVI
jgi:hypothetical protein